MESFTKHKHAGSRILRGVFYAAAAVSMATPLMAAAQQARCDGRLFLSQEAPTGLNLIVTAANPMTFQAIGATSNVTYNALGYSPLDGVLYGMRSERTATVITCWR